MQPDFAMEILWEASRRSYGVISIGRRSAREEEAIKRLLSRGFLVKTGRWACGSKGNQQARITDAGLDYAGIKPGPPVRCL